MSSTARTFTRAALGIGAVILGIFSVSTAVSGSFGGALVYAVLAAAAANYGIIRPLREKRGGGHAVWVAAIVLAIAIGGVGEETGLLMTQSARDAKAQREQDRAAASADAPTTATAEPTVPTSTRPPIESAPECVLPTVVVEKENWTQTELGWRRDDVTIKVTNNSRLPILPWSIDTVVYFRALNGVEIPSASKLGGGSPDRIPENRIMPTLAYGESATVSRSFGDMFYTDGSQPRVVIKDVWWDFAEDDASQRARCSGQNELMYGWLPE
ncbi:MULTISPECIES: hypothetical protein [Nocardiaceae]|uniref:hypothetical protein n=1 Tax=Nocardiaceae TaxID=85025 RepID=UPI0011A30405|nr:hypothetical protein [Prescottella equi]